MSASDHKPGLLVVSEPGEVMKPGFSDAFVKPFFEAHGSDFENPENQLGDEEAGDDQTDYISECENRLG